MFIGEALKPNLTRIVTAAMVRTHVAFVRMNVNREKSLNFPGHEQCFSRQRSQRPLSAPLTDQQGPFSICTLFKFTDQTRSQRRLGATVF